MKKTRLEIQYLFNFELFGIISPVKEYKLAWEINRILCVQLSKKNDLILEFSGFKTITVSQFQFITDHGELKLIKNKAVELQLSGTPTYLVPELKNFDYILKIEGLKDSLPYTFVLNELKQSEFIHFINRLSIESLKSKDNLIF